jgi:parvulin-like peptidyl-prolyl isomerase
MTQETSNREQADRVTRRSTRAKSNVSDQKNRRRRNFLIAAIMTVVVVLVAGVAIYLDQVAPFRTAVVTVDDSAVTMRTFLRRAFISGQDPLVLLQVIANEEIVKLVAPAPPYNVRVDEEDIDEFLRSVARGDSAEITESEFKEWYRQQINESRMPDREFRDLVRTNLLMRRFREHLADRVPTVAQQVHLHMIPIDGLAAAQAARERLDGGEDFASIAREVSADESIRLTGGDLGWQARAGLVPQIARIAFDELVVGQISEPFYIDEEIFSLIMVSERADARELDPAARQRIQDRVLDEWLIEEQQYHEVEYHGFSGGYGAETDAWIKWQLQKMQQ